MTHVEPSVGPQEPKDEAERRQYRQPNLQPTPEPHTVPEMFRAVKVGLADIASQLRYLRKEQASDFETLKCGLFEHLTCLVGDLQSAVEAGFELEPREADPQDLGVRRGGKLGLSQSFPDHSRPLSDEEF